MDACALFHVKGQIHALTSAVKAWSTLQVVSHWEGAGSASTALTGVSVGGTSVFSPTRSMGSSAVRPGRGRAGSHLSPLQRDGQTFSSMYTPGYPWRG